VGQLAKYFEFRHDFPDVDAEMLLVAVISLGCRYIIPFCSLELHKLRERSSVSSYEVKDILRCIRDLSKKEDRTDISVSVN